MNTPSCIEVAPCIGAGIVPETQDNRKAFNIRQWEQNFLKVNWNIVIHFTSFPQQNASQYNELARPVT